MRKRPVAMLILVLMTAMSLAPAYAQGTVTAGDFQYELDEGGKATITFYTGSETGTLVIPDQMDGHPVAAIGKAAIMGNQFTSVVIPAGLTVIPPGTFANCEYLASFDVAAGNPVFEQVEGILFDKTQKQLHTYPRGRPAADYQIPAGTLLIGSGAFLSSELLVTVSLPDSLTAIGENAFNGCKLLGSLTVSGSVSSIGSGAFAGCASLQSVYIPGSVKSIGTGFLDGCLSLSSLTVAADNPVFEVVGGVLFDKAQKMLHTYPQTLTDEIYQVPDGTLQIGALAFSSCVNLTSVTIPDSVTAIGESAFMNCTKLKEVVLPKGLSRLEAGVFSTCGKLYSIAVPDSVTYIGPQAFFNCTDLRNVNIPYGVTALEPYTFAYCGNIRDIAIPGTVTSIGDGTFMACDFMTNVWIPSGVQTIGAYAFAECAVLTVAAIPASVTVIGDQAFSGNASMVANVVENSYAHQYFTQYNLPFALINP